MAVNDSPLLATPKSFSAGLSTQSEKSQPAKHVAQPSVNSRLRNASHSITVLPSPPLVIESLIQIPWVQFAASWCFEMTEKINIQHLAAKLDLANFKRE